jgi:hypothetical protein
VTNRVWAGTRDGLFAEHQRVWNQYMGGEVQSLAFGSDGTLWAGRRTGLERWLPPGDNPAALRKPSNVYRADSSGLAASKVTALAVQATERGQEVWAGSLAGLSRLQTWKEK